MTAPGASTKQRPSFDRAVAALLTAALGTWAAPIAAQTASVEPRTAPIAASESRLAPANSDRDIIVTDFEGHVILRFGGVGPDGLDAAATDEIGALLRADEVPEDLEADLRFESEPVDADWASPTARRIREHVLAAGPGYAAIHVECRSSSCRAHLYEASRLTVLEHQQELSLVQPVIESLIAANAAEFEPVFLMAAFSQGLETPYIRVILQRAR